MEIMLKLQINGFCIAIIAILWFSGDRRKASRAKADYRIYTGLLASTAAMLLLDSAGWLLNGNRSRSLVLAVNALYYAVHSLPTALFVLYADFHVYRDEARSAKLARPLFVIVALLAMAAAASGFTRLFFYLDEANCYSRGPAFPLFAVAQYGLLAYGLGLVVAKAKLLNPRILIALLAYPLPSIVAAVLQMLVFGLVLIWPATTLFLVVAAFNIENRRARTDYLTGTANRRSLDEELERSIAALRPGLSLCGLLIDLDDFKMINDRFGHESGDRALEDVASILLSAVRASDLVARMGGDEFVVLLDFREEGALEELVSRIERAVESHNHSRRRPYRLGLSIGRACFHKAEGRSAAEFLALLDADMYARKKLKKASAV
jgi:diguanylate cyclase (GGDEF)-like protein